MRHTVFSIISRGHFDRFLKSFARVNVQLCSWSTARSNLVRGFRIINGPSGIQDFGLRSAPDCPRERFLAINCVEARGSG